MEIKFSKHVKFPRQVPEFLQMMVNRLIVGNHQYGAPDPRKAYLKRLLTELDRYHATHNKEHLINVANYALLESLTATHHDPTVDSATRKIYGKKSHEGNHYPSQSPPTQGHHPPCSPLNQTLPTGDPMPDKKEFFVSFGLGNVHKNSFARVRASNRDIVMEYATQKNLFPGWSHVYTFEEWTRMDWTPRMTEIPCVMELP